jgi:hypothetical protein
MSEACRPSPNAHAAAETKRPAEAGRLLSITYRCRWSGRTALWDACHPLREPDSAGRVSGRRPAAGRASEPAFDSAARAGFGSSWCFLSWERQYNGPPSGFVPDQERCGSQCRKLCQPDVFGFASCCLCFLSSATHVALRGHRCSVTPRANTSSSAITIRTHKHRPTNKRELLFRSNHSRRARLIQC